MKRSYDNILLFEIPDTICQQYGGRQEVFLRSTAAGVVLVTANEYVRQSRNFCNYLLSNGLQKGDRVLTLMQNSPEWNYAENGILQAGGIHVPLTPFYTNRQLLEILKITRPAWIFSSSASLLKRMRNLANSLFLQCEYRLTGAIFPDIFQSSANSVLAYGLSGTITPDDIAVILFTSGSTGMPKAVALSHRNMLTAINDFSGADFFNAGGRYLSLLQLPLSAERKVNYSCQLRGISVCYPSAHRSISDSMEFFKPQLTAMVPFLLSELYRQRRNEKKPAYHLQTIICGGAAVPAHLIRYFEERGLRVMEVYGLTETASLLAYNTLTRNKEGTVGMPSPSVEISFSADGEILVKGGSVMSGYMRENFVCESARDAEGWFHTGDTGELDAEGFLKITGRKKNAFKNSRGAYVHPEEIENELMQTALFEYVMITGDNADALAAIVKPGTNDAARIREAFQRFNEGRADELKIMQFGMLSGSADFISAAQKPDRVKAAKLVNGDNFISVY